jgi:hypothetical protein
MGHYFKSQAQKQPTAMGSLLQSSAYGSAIPVIYGMTQSPPLAIWAGNIRQGGDKGKFKQTKKGITQYVEDIDFLLGHNPGRGVNQIMYNGSLLPLNLENQSFSYEGTGSVAVTDSNFYSVIAVTCVQSYSFVVDDYGSPVGSQTLTGTFEVPLWNVLENGPDPTDNSATRNFPFCYSWQPTAYGVAGDGPTVNIEDNGQLSGSTIKVYYTALVPGELKLDGVNQPPLAYIYCFLENKLGSGNEYSDANLSDQQIIYQQFFGIASTRINLGASGALPQILPEVAGKWGVYSTGDGDFADMIEDTFKSGLAQGAIGG